MPSISGGKTKDEDDEVLLSKGLESCQPLANKGKTNKSRFEDCLGMAENELLEEEMAKDPIGGTECFGWYATPIGIAALWKGEKQPKSPPYELALQQGLEVGLDLSREEKEFHQTGHGLVLLFHS